MRSGVNQLFLKMNVNDKILFLLISTGVFLLLLRLSCFGSFWVNLLRSALLRDGKSCQF